MPCKPRCIYCTIYIFIFMFMLSFFLFLIITNPSRVKLYATEATLTQFNLLTSNNTLYYNFKDDQSNRLVQDNDFDRVSLTPFDQGYKNTTFLQAVFEGQSVIILKPKQLGEYKEETSVGIYNDSAVDLDLRIRAKFGRIKCRYFNPRLSVPLALNGKSAPPN
ncbi:hypothetical protein JHK87_018015 [Glycine soja]|nr:hypothetical protein JHK87_018015 [Glycine soja]